MEAEMRAFCYQLGVKPTRAQLVRKHLWERCAAITRQPPESWLGFCFGGEPAESGLGYANGRQQFRKLSLEAAQDLEVWPLISRNDAQLTHLWHCRMPGQPGQPQALSHWPEEPQARGPLTQSVSEDALLLIFGQFLTNLLCATGRLVKERFLQVLSPASLTAMLRHGRRVSMLVGPSGLNELIWKKVGAFCGRFWTGPAR